MEYLSKNSRFWFSWKKVQFRFVGSRLNIDELNNMDKGSIEAIVISSDDIDGDHDDETERKDDSPQIDQNKRAGYLRSGRRFK